MALGRKEVANWNQAIDMHHIPQDHWLFGSEPPAAWQTERYPTVLCSTLGNVCAKVLHSLTHRWGDSTQAQPSPVPHSLSMVSKRQGNSGNSGKGLT